LDPFSREEPKPEVDVYALEKVNYVCHKALVESQISAGQFWSKYR
jgi:hypothetical protein